MYILATIILWSLSTLIMVAGSKYRPLRWICLLGYIVGGGVLGKFLSDINWGNVHIAFINRLFYRFLLSVSFNFAPFILLMFSISYSGWFSTKHLVGKLYFKLFLLIPPIITIIFFGLKISSYKYRIFLIIWATPYFFITNYILIRSLLKEKVVFIKRQKLSTCVTISAATIYGYISCHLIPILKIRISIQRDILATFALLIIFVVLSSRYGIWGVKLNFERYDPFNSILTLSSGTLILTHTLKNEMNKVAMCAQNIKTIPKNDVNRIEKNADIILDSSQYVLDMVKKIKDQIAEIRLEKNMENIASLIEDCLGMVKPFTDTKNISVTKNYSGDTIISMDRKNVKEVLVNIFMNSVEASKPGDSLSICVYIDGRYHTIAVTDTGEGIENENLHKVVQPFFTTKKGESNFGLGLSFCYNVMQKHNGLMEIQSMPGAGTTIYLKFPYY
ncbi:sensor histidine kinase [Ruminiclostridium papyrosolvens]|uniref:histidine kinase n=1 Tax=Ruminiclostridium papyrosolvens C7 TaxID=1330534 RepID=U4R2A2_9FIRM|nr:HAMP domain-containing sensor histidine kinase [Ruminiclostridium papyrosolvens]EPR11738.1 hypothetical protein L323_11005 [Ruminiclostridium papyrosolvens C7]